MTGSLAYRTHAAAIWNGTAPEKYRRLLPYIHGRRILELGAAEGVLSLLLADRDPAATITALELRHERHADGLALQARWRALGRHVEACTMACGDIRDRLDLLNGVETVVAVRAIYYLRESIAPVFAAIAEAGVSSVVLCGNGNRARRYAQTHGDPGDNLGRFNLYAGVAGMTSALTFAGYTIGTVVTEGDPIVTGHR